MNKYFICIFLFLSSIFLYAKDDKLQRTKQKLNNFNSISYKSTAFYPNPETDKINSFKTFYIVNNYKNKNFDFYSKSDNSEEIFQNDDYTEINTEDKTIYKYEEKQNQNEMIQNSRLVQYGPTFLINHNWKYENDVVTNGTKQAHYSFIESVNQYEEKTIKIEFHIYISPNYTISKFERKSFVDNKLGQIVTFEFSEYKFSKKAIKFRTLLAENYALKYFERNEISPLQKGIKAPNFDAQDLNSNRLSEQNFIGNQTLLLFSSTDCGASKVVFDFLNNQHFKLPNKLNLINIYASDTKENVAKYFNNNLEKFQIIVNQKELENKYQISGYPIMYLIDKNGIIIETFDGYEQIIQFLKSEIKS